MFYPFIGAEIFEDLLKFGLIMPGSYPLLHLQQFHFLIYQSLWLPFHTGRCWVLPLSWFKWFPESLTTSLDESFAFEHVFLPLASFRSPGTRQLCLTQAQPLVPVQPTGKLVPSLFGPPWILKMPRALSLQIPLFFIHGNCVIQFLLENFWSLTSFG